VTTTVSSVESGLGRPSGWPASATAASEPAGGSGPDNRTSQQPPPAASGAAAADSYGATNGSGPAASSTSAANDPAALRAPQQLLRQQQLWPVEPSQPRSSGNGSGPADPARGSAERDSAGNAPGWQSPTSAGPSHSGGTPRCNGSGAFSPEQVHRHHPPHPPLAWAGTVGAGGAAWGVPLQGGQPEEQPSPREAVRRREQQRQTGGTYNWWRPPFG
jgi:hypothetical protein